MIISNRRICKTIKLCELIYIFPYPFIISMENMGPILMHINIFTLKFFNHSIF